MTDRQFIALVANRMKLVKSEREDIGFSFSINSKWKKVEDMINEYLTLMLSFLKDDLESVAERLLFILDGLAAEVEGITEGGRFDYRDTVREIFVEIPGIRDALICDATEMYRNDPSVNSVAEVMLCCPGFYAIAVYRLSHLFYLKGLFCLARLVSELAHSKTGIDIHPGAKIGRGCAIDHGTGIVIGETAEIGDNVRIYQSVTIGAKSFEADALGILKKGGKRHPNIGAGCVIYAGATILGGETTIGQGSVIGCGVRVTKSVPPGSIIK